MSKPSPEPETNNANGAEREPLTVAEPQDARAPVAGQSPAKRRKIPFYKATARED